MGGQRALIIATSETPAEIGQEIRSGTHYRIDYLELSARLKARYIDYQSVGGGRVARAIEDRLRLDLRQAVHAARIVGRQRCEVVMCMSERVGLGMSLLPLARVRRIIQFHHPMSRRKLQLIKALGLQHRWSLALVPSSAEARAFSAALGLPPGRVRTLNPSPIDLDFFAPSRCRPRADLRPHVLSAGLSHRDYPCLLEAMRAIPHVRCDVRVGSAWAPGREQLSGQDVPPNVHLRPFVRPNVLRDCYSAARFVVVPIRPTTQWSAGCTTVLHAQAMGRAVIASAVPGLYDFVEHGQTGLLVPPGDPAALARAVDELWSDPERAAEMGRRARAWVESRFSLDRWLDTVSTAMAEPA
jgi:glycosyltransferase involved in cell wall biosynthesis